MTPYEYCRFITDKSQSPLVQARSHLPENKAIMFDVCYAAMRLIDDYVDETYLVDGAVDKDTAIAHVNNWEMSIRAGFDGMYGDTCPEYDLLMQAVNQRMSDVDMPVTPFRQLAQAMRWDISQTPLKTTMDFQDYCVGATNAPTYIYLYILSADVGQGYAENPHLSQLEGWARIFGEYCYLIHIARDLQADIAKQSTQQITIPTKWLEQWGTDIESLMAGNGIDTVRAGLLDKAGAYTPDVHTMVAQVEDILETQEKQAFSFVIGCYLKLHQKLSQS